ncbi:MAG: single-stranded DNA-binding protein [Gallicola sp.]|nr:single-stranded DNA-binding protein [Gallicola sp.]
MNRIDLIGNLTKDVELKKTNNGTDVANFTLACDKPYKVADEASKTDFFRCELFGNMAKSLYQHTRKGSKLYASGYLVFQDYTSQDGTPTRSTVVRVQTVRFLSKSTKEAHEDVSSDEVVEESDMSEHYDSE